MTETLAARLLAELRATVQHDYQHDRERSLVLTKLDEAELWLTRCTVATS